MALQWAEMRNLHYLAKFHEDHLLRYGIYYFSSMAAAAVIDFHKFKI